MKKLPSYIYDFSVYFFILLFCYAGISKVFDFENFQVQIGQSPLLSAYAGFISYAVITAEFIIVLGLIFEKSRLHGLYASTALMTAFTVYIYLILNYSDFVPCSCGGILEKMGWTEHLVFNITCVVLGVIAVHVDENKNDSPKKRTMVLLLFTNFLSCLTVLLLFFSSEYIIKKENNFTRRFLMHPLIKKNSLDMGTSSLYFAGITDDHLYLGDRNLPQQLISLDSLLRNPERLKINLDHNLHTYKKLDIKIHHGNYYIYDGTVPMIRKGKIGNSNNNLVSLNDVFFTQLEILNDNRLVLRTQSSKTKNLMLGSLTLHGSGKNQVHLHPQLLERQNDGVFDSDGYLSVDKKNNLISYIYSYRNQFLVLDSGMHLQRKMKTIDTIQKAQIQTRVLSDGRYKMEKPPLKVNGRAIPFMGLLLNPSELRGKNESMNRWKKNKVVDIYRTDRQEYIGSLYIEKFEDETLTDFILTEKYFYAIVGKQLIQYRITNSLRKHFKNGETENRSKE